MFFYGVDATKKPTAAPLGADNTYRSPFLCPQEESDLRAFFRMSRSAFSLVTSRLRRAISSCSGFIWPWPGKAWSASSADFFTQSRNCDGCTPRSCDAWAGHAPFLDQPHSLKLELARKLPSLHDPPPAPSKHLTRCLRNRLQAMGTCDRLKGWKGAPYLSRCTALRTRAL